MYEPKWQSLRLQADYLMAFQPWRPLRDLYGGFLLVHRAKVNVAGGGLRVD